MYVGRVNCQYCQRHTSPQKQIPKFIRGMAYEYEMAPIKGHRQLSRHNRNQERKVYQMSKNGSPVFTMQRFTMYGEKSLSTISPHIRKPPGDEPLAVALASLPTNEVLYIHSPLQKKKHPEQCRFLICRAEGIASFSRVRRDRSLLIG